MFKIKEDSTAYPYQHRQKNGDLAKFDNGMTIRTYLAGQVLTGLVASHPNIDIAVEVAILYADKLIIELNKSLS
jgi:hypothetical protein